ncbi:Minor extracellular protease vpr 12 [Phlyctema vagabunda]|uniref:Minor extracellular protease vpr 12 n=1 Tax=Phlyctema vagabunda TaxID=108571 RepID=A0ABR4P8P0_9HELO
MNTMAWKQQVQSNSSGSYSHQAVLTPSSVCLASMSSFQGKFAAVALAVASTFVPAITAAAVKPANIVEGAYIVEFTQSDSLVEPSFFSNLTDSNISATPRISLNHELFKGASFKIAAAQDIEETVAAIQSMAMVNKIWPVRTYDNPANVIGTLDEYMAKNAKISKRELLDTFSPHVMGGVDKLHAEGFTGEGLFIGVIDTGVDYKHPALGGCFGPGCKVVAGYDLVGDAYTGSNTPVPDADPIDCGGHGTHVSGIIGADNNPFNFTGVAPNATLGMWKVFGCEGSAGNDVLIAAFNMAYEAGADVISASIGGSSGWTEDPWDVAVQRITEKGVPCIIAAGNDGANGLFDTSTAAESIGATAVGSIDNINQPALLYGADYSVEGGNATAAANLTRFWYAKGEFGDFGTVTVPLYAVTLDTTIPNDACTPLPANTPDLSDYVVLIRRGSCTFDTKIANVVAFGATRVLFYNNVPTAPSAPGDTYTDVAVGQVSAAQGAEWIAELKSGSKITVSFITLSEAPQLFTDEPNPFTGGYMSTFSSWGPSFEAWIKPEVSAPGGLILSTYLLNQGGYAVLSGTSMATPYIAGVVGLIKQIRGKSSLSPDAITSLLASTATPVNFGDGTTGYDFLAPVVQQGGGLVNAYEAAYTTTFLDLDNIALNDTVYFKAAHPITISNTGDTAQTYTFSNEIAATAFTLSDGGIFPDVFPPNLASDAASAATIRFNPTTLTVPAKSSGVFTAHFTRPQGLDAARIPVYSGFVAINGTNGDTLSLPYAGVASRLKDAKIVDYVDGFPYISTSTDADHAPVANETIFILPSGNSTTNSTAGLPEIVYALAMGSRILRIDVVPENVRNLPRILGEQVLGSIAGYPVENVPRNSLFTAAWDGKLSDGRVAPAGRYKFMIRALRIFGDVTYNHDYERYDTGYINIKYA